MINITASLVKELRLRTGVGVMECKKALIKNKGNIEYSVDYLRKLGISKAEKKLNTVTTQGSIFTFCSNNVSAILELNCESDFVAKDNQFIIFGNNIVRSICDKAIYNIHILRKKFESKRIELISKFDENIFIKRINFLSNNYIGTYVHGTRIGVLVGTNTFITQALIKNIAMHIAASKPEFLNSYMIPDNIINRERNIQLEIAMKSAKSNFIADKIVQGRMSKFTDSISLMGQKFILDPEYTVNQYLLNNNTTVTSFVRFEIGG